MQIETGGPPAHDPADGDENRYTEPARQREGNVATHATWPHGSPALRIGRRRAAAKPAANPASPPVVTRPPRHLRLLRLVVGLVLLVLAWCGVVFAVLLARSALRPARPDHVALDTTLSVLKFCAVGWVGIATLACIVAGAFSLTLALSNRDWR